MYLIFFLISSVLKYHYNVKEFKINADKIKYKCFVIYFNLLFIRLF